MITSCSPKKEEAMDSVKPTKRIVLYQMMTRLFGNTNTNNSEWGTIKENGVGKFDDITDKALKALSNKGYTHVWYTGIIEHALLSDYTAYGIPLDDADVVKGRAGSPYAIKDYYDVNPDLANDVPNRIYEFQNLVKRTHKAGLKVIIDNVPNHVARGYQSDASPVYIMDFGIEDNTELGFDPGNNFYYLPNSSFTPPKEYNSLGNNEFPTKNSGFNETPAKVSGNDVFSASPSINDWFETVKLNYGVDVQNDRKTHFDPVPDTWLKMKDVFVYWADMGVDGFRCDMAEMVPVEFWKWVTTEVNELYPEVIFIAEIYNPDAYREYIFTGGFDYLYDKVEMYDTLKHIIQGSASADDITSVWQRQEGIESYMLRFLENHDEQRIASPYFAGDPLKGIPMMAASSFMHTGPIMMYYGQDVGEPGKGESGFSGDDGRTTIFDYWGVPEHIKWVNNGAFDGGLLTKDQLELSSSYESILQAVNKNEAFTVGSFYDLQYFNRNENFEGYTSKIYSFLRYTDKQVILVIINFGEENENVEIKIPKEAWELLDINSEYISVEEKSIDLKSTSNYNVKSDLSFNIPGLDYQIVYLK